MSRDIAAAGLRSGCSAAAPQWQRSATQSEHQRLRNHCAKKCPQAWEAWCCRASRVVHAPLRGRAARERSEPPQQTGAHAIGKPIVDIAGDQLCRKTQRARMELKRQISQPQIGAHANVRAIELAV